MISTKTRIKELKKFGQSEIIMSISDIEELLQHKSKNTDLKKRLRKSTLSIKAHPDYQTGRNQEFVDIVDLNEEMLTNLEDNE